MSSTAKGILGLLIWLVVGFSFTEITTIALSAWLNHQSLEHRPSQTVATLP